MSKTFSNPNLDSISHIFRLGFPIALQSTALALMGLVNSLMVSDLGETSLAAVGIGARWLTYISLLIFALSSGGQILLAQYVGAGDNDRFRKTALMSAYHIFFVSILIGTGFILFPGLVISAFTSSPEIATEAFVYIQFMGGVIFLTGLSVAIDTIFRSLGKTRVPLYAYLIEFLVNITLNYLLIFGNFGFPEMGVTGAAVASFTARSLRIVALMTILYCEERINLFSTRSLRCAFDRRLINKFYPVAWPLVASSLIWTSGGFTMHLVFGHLGDRELAVMSLITPFELVALAFISGVCCGTSICIGHALGADKTDLARSLARSAGFLSLVVGSGAAIVFTSIAYYYVLNQEAWDLETQSMIAAALPILGLSIIARTITSTQLHGILKSGGDVKFCLYVDVICQWGIAIPSVIYFGIYLGYDLVTVYFIVQIEELLKIIPCQIRIHSNKWARNLAVAA